MKQRIQTAAILIIVLLLVLFLLPKSVMPYLMSVVLLVFAWEWTKVNQLNAKDSTIIYCFSLFFYVLALSNNNVFLLLTAISVLNYAWAFLLVYNFEKNTDFKINNSYLTIIGPLLLSTFAAGFIRLDASDLKLLVYLLIIVGIADSGAYFVGRSIGKIKLCPRTSPKKTVEGLLGGLVIALIVATLFHKLLTPNLSFGFMLLVSLLVVVYSVIGDLFESLIKRQNDIKDSSNILPGHGGVLDRIDGLLPALPLFILLIISFGNIKL